MGSYEECSVLFLHHSSQQRHSALWRRRSRDLRQKSEEEQGRTEKGDQEVQDEELNDESAEEIDSGSTDENEDSEEDTEVRIYRNDQFLAFLFPLLLLAVWSSNLHPLVHTQVFEEHALKTDGNQNPRQPAPEITPAIIINQPDKVSLQRRLTRSVCRFFVLCDMKADLAASLMLLSCSLCCRSFQVLTAVAG